MPDTVYIDLEAGLARIRGNKKIYLRMLGLFVNSPEFAKLEEALAAGDNAAAGDVAHAIKGMSGNLDLPQVFRLSADLMNQLRQGEAEPATLAEYREALDATLEEVKAVMAKLEEELR